MKASVVEGYPKGNKMKILIEDVDASQVNALRRAIISDVPKMAIDKVMFTLGVNQDNNRGEIFESVNALPDEVIAHRLAMIPFQHAQTTASLLQTTARIVKTWQRKTVAVRCVKFFTHSTYKAHPQTATSRSMSFVQAI